MFCSKVIRWWRDFILVKKLEFSRDWLVENFLPWAMGIAGEPNFSKWKKGLTKLICILMVIDYIYEVYGSLDELELFTEVVKRWEWCWGVGSTWGRALKSIYVAYTNASRFWYQYTKAQYNHLYPVLLWCLIYSKGHSFLLLTVCKINM